MGAQLDIILHQSVSKRHTSEGLQSLVKKICNLCFCSFGRLSIRQVYRAKRPKMANYSQGNQGTKESSISAV
jgi:hypothetical protein